VLADDGTPVKVITVVPEDSTVADGIRRAGAEVVTVPKSNGRVDLFVAFQELYERGIESVLVEGGAQIATEIIRRRLADELVLFIAPKIIGSGIDAIGDLGVLDMEQAVRFSSSSVQLSDGDIVFRGTPVWPE